MKNKFVKLIFITLFLTACSQENLIDQMKNEVPLQKGAVVLETNSIPKERMSIIQFEVDGSEVSEDDLIEFYKKTMITKGWEFEKINKWAGNGSVFTMTKKDWGILTIQTITKNMQKTNKLKVIINLTRI